MITRSLLVRGEREAWGYGAYSYLLIPRSPQSDPRYAALLHAYCSLPNDEVVSETGQATKRTQRNITYVPTQRTLHAEPPGETWLLQNYDTERAASMLIMHELRDRGPYIVTTVQPLTQPDQSASIAVIDLSQVSTPSIAAWFEHFISATQGNNAWMRDGAEIILLRLHGWLESLGLGVNTTMSAIEPTGKILHAFDTKR